MDWTPFHIDLSGLGSYQVMSPEIWEQVVRDARMVASRRESWAGDHDPLDFLLNMNK